MRRLFWLALVMLGCNAAEEMPQPIVLRVVSCHGSLDGSPWTWTATIDSYKAVVEATGGRWEVPTGQLTERHLMAPVFAYHLESDDPARLRVWTATAEQRADCETLLASSP
jgi:hypothetical protein